MAKHDERPGTGKPRAQQMEAQRREREAAALRENLARRKAQQRARRDRPPGAGEGPDQTGD